MPYDYAKLAGKITEVFTTQARFAEAMNLSERSISMKINGKIGWKQSEITRACNLLGLENAEIPVYFFALGVQD